MGTIGATFYLIGVGLIYMMTGTLNLADMEARIHEVSELKPILVAAGFITIGLALKAAVFPLHIWLPASYTYAPHIVTAFLAACSIKVALYVLLRFDFVVFQQNLPDHAIQFSIFLAPLAVLAILIASGVAVFEQNLKRLDTDYIDLLQCHIHLPEPNLEYFLEGFQQLQRLGKVRSYGVSSSQIDFIKKFNADGGTAALQIDYSILNRTAEKEIFPYCQENDIGVIVRGPLAMGILTGKFSIESRFPERDFRRNWHENSKENSIFLDDLGKVDQLREVVGEQSLAQLALQFVLSHPAGITVIPGAKTVQQLEQNVAVGHMPPLSREVLDQIDAIVPSGGGRKIWPA